MCAKFFVYFSCLRFLRVRWRLKRSWVQHKPFYAIQEVVCGLNCESIQHCSLFCLFLSESDKILREVRRTQKISSLFYVVTWKLIIILQISSSQYPFQLFFYFLSLYDNKRQHIQHFPTITYRHYTRSIDWYPKRVKIYSSFIFLPFTLHRSIDEGKEMRKSRQFISFLPSYLFLCLHYSRRMNEWVKEKVKYK